MSYEQKRVRLVGWTAAGIWSDSRQYFT
jgi:hypothetical protein